MTASLFFLFGVAYTVAYSFRSQIMLRFLRGYWGTMGLVNLNILIWVLLSLWRIRSGDVPFWPFNFTGVQNEAVAFLVAFLGLYMLVALEYLTGFDTGFNPPINLFSVSEMAIFGSLEEVIWRAYVLNAIGGWVGWLLSSLGFALHHVGSSWRHALYALIAGLILGGVYLRTGAFWGVFLAHGLFNFSIIFRRWIG